MAPLKVAVIGGGPGAMFFCHSYQKQRQEAIQNKNKDFVELQITCFERKSTPGGVWRSSPPSTSQQQEEANSAYTRIYDELWTNGPSPAIEFYDYTFQEHFGGKDNNNDGKLVQVPMYFPRRDVHEYIVSRVTKDNPNFFNDFFQLNTEVVHVCYDNDQFSITLKDMCTLETRCETFDKCIWAGGENGIKSIPQSLRELFASAEDDKSPSVPAVGTEYDSSSTKSSAPILLHSTETHAIRQHVAGQTVLLIGGSYSAEDLALQCLKWGAENIHISTRDPTSAVTWTSAWPANKVQVHPGVAVKRVNKDEGYSIELEEVQWKWPEGYVPCKVGEEEKETHVETDCKELVRKDKLSEEKKDDGDSLTETLCTTDTDESDWPPTLTGVGLVVFCTGYKANINMLDQSLRPTNGSIPQWYMGDMPFESKLLNDEWRMAEDNPAQKFTGHIPPCRGRMTRLNYNHPDMHRGVFFSNPNMMFLCEHGSEAPLVSLDVHSWLLCSYLTRRLTMPSVEDLRAANEQQVVDQLGIAYIRYCMDEGYCRALDKLSGFWEPTESSPDNCAWWDCERQYEKYQFRLLAKIMDEGQYPGASLGTYSRLNSNGRALYDFGVASYETRDERAMDTKEDRKWRTFRDDDKLPSSCYSLYTKAKVRPLKKKWLDAVGDVSIRSGDV